MGDRTPADVRDAAALRVEAVVNDWCARDYARVFLQIDREIIDSTRTIRALIVEQLQGGGERSRDLHSACGVLGRLIASRNGSPTLAALAVDGAIEATAMADSSWAAPARAALAEGYAAARQEIARREATARWEYPMCAVPLHEGIVAIAAGYPDDDDDALTAWAARVANAAVLSGARRVVTAGTPAARAALAEALNLAGVELLASYALSPAGRSR